MQHMSIFFWSMDWLKTARSLLLTTCISDHMKTSRFVRAFNEKIAQDARLSPVMLPIRDGVTLIEVSGLDEKTNLQKVEQLVGELVKLDITPKLANKTAITEG